MSPSLLLSFSHVLFLSLYVRQPIYLLLYLNFPSSLISMRNLTRLPIRQGIFIRLISGGVTVTTPLMRWSGFRVD
jgi:hypothetical protein